MHKVSIVPCPDYRLEPVIQIVDRQVSSFFQQSIQGKRVLLKPNILADAEVEKRITTDPAVFEAAVLAFRKLGAVVMAGDSPAMHTKKFDATKCGIRGVCDRLNVQWINFTDDSIERAGFKLTSAAADADIIVSLSKLKTHELTYFTGSVKNLYGMIPGYTKSKLHVKYPDRESFSAMLIDLLEAIKPHFTIMDGIIGMEGPGPHNGTPRKVGFLLAGINPAAVDMAACELIGYNPMDIPMLREAAERKLIPRSIQQLEFTDENPSDHRIRSFKKIRLAGKNSNILLQFAMAGPLKKAAARFARRPVFTHSNCIRCGKCIRMCAAEAITFTDRRGMAIELDRERCIRCYCCAEVCPESAVRAGRKFSDR